MRASSSVIVARLTLKYIYSYIDRIHMCLSSLQFNWNQGRCRCCLLFKPRASQTFRISWKRLATRWRCGNYNELFPNEIIFSFNKCISIRHFRSCVRWSEPIIFYWWGSKPAALHWTCFVEHMQLSASHELLLMRYLKVVLSSLNRFLIKAGTA